MKKKICIVLVSFLMLAMPFNINMYAAAENSTNANTVEESSEVEQQTEQSIEYKFDDNIPSDDNNEYIADNTMDFIAPTIEYVPVEEIELSEYKDEMYVKETQNLSATVYPITASSKSIQYSTSDSSVATISSSGKINAIGSGNCRIYAECDGVSIYFDLKVRVKTEAINVKSKYVVIKPEEQFDLEVSVSPSDASHNLKFKSKNESIAVIGNDGVITAKSSGSTSVIVSNEDSTILVNVIVSTDDKDSISQNNIDNSNDINNNKSDSLTEQIKNSNNKEIVVKGIKKISSSALKELYGTDKTLIVELDDYDLSIRGQDIYNANNEIDTQLDISSTDNGVSVKIVDDKKLPGTISIKLKNTSKKYKYFYLVEGKTNDYHRLNALSNNMFKISSVGEYFLSTKNMEHFKINLLWCLGGVGVILLMSLIYIFSKKKYWFW